MDGPDIHSVVERKCDTPNVVARQKLATFFVGQFANCDRITVCHRKYRPGHGVEVGERQSVGESADTRKDVGVSRLLSSSLGAIASQEFRSFPTVSMLFAVQFASDRRVPARLQRIASMRMPSWR